MVILKKTILLKVNKSMKENKIIILILIISIILIIIDQTSKVIVKSKYNEPIGNDIISIENNICTLETAVQCRCCADDKEHFLEICFVVRYDLSSEMTADVKIDCISEEYYD